MHAQMGKSFPAWICVTKWRERWQHMHRAWKEKMGKHASAAKAKLADFLLVIYANVFQGKLILSKWAGLLFFQWREGISPICLIFQFMYSGAIIPRYISQGLIIIPIHNGAGMTDITATGQAKHPAIHAMSIVILTKVNDASLPLIFLINSSLELPKKKIGSLKSLLNTKHFLN